MRLTALHRLWIDDVVPAAGDVEVFVRQGDEIVEGALHVGQRWYRIEDGLLDVRPDALGAAEGRRRFAERHGLPEPEEAVGASATDRGAAAKIDQIAFFRDDVRVYDRDVSQRSFYVASDRICFGDWADALPPGGAVCDIGAGSGRVTVPLAQRGFEVVATDLSEEMLRLARRRAIDTGVGERVTGILADAERLPLGSAQFAAAVCYGVLHHVPDPAAVVAEAGRILQPGGRWLSYDPHRSRVRFLFDWTMKLVRLYDELASANPLLTAADLERWCAAAAIQPEVRLHFFLPPHLLAPLPPRAAERCLRWSDTLFTRLGLGALAGVVAVTGRKAGASVPA